MTEKSRKELINQLVTNIVASYKKELYIKPHDLCPLPNRDVIIEISKMLRQLLFPGYFSKQTGMSEIIEYHTGELILGIQDKLSEQIVFALCLEANKSQAEATCRRVTIKKQADDITYEFLSRIPRVREYLATDVQAAFDGDPAATSKDEIIFSYPGIFAMSIYRVAHELYLLKVPLIPRILSEYAHNITGIDIHSGATIGKYFFIDHGTGVVIGETTMIGDYAKIYQGVTLGALSTRGGQALRGFKRHPTLEDGVTVYSGASILGGETVIGADAVIGSNAFITKSVPSGTKVSIKNPELIFKGNSSTEYNPEYIADWVI
ncbi:MAG: serine acetyltransferase [Eubacteriaceae bacterium]|nr:serine acetyltransferase [Eubacteriaceae bacterium]